MVAERGGSKKGGRGEGRLKATPVTNFPGPFWEPFSSKNDEKIDAKIDAEKVMKFHKKIDATMRLILSVF